MNDARTLVVETAELRRRTGSRRDLRRTARLPELRVGERSVVDGELELALVVEAVTEGVAVKGTVRGRWVAPCRRCLEEMEGDLEIVLHEIFEVLPTEGETWPLTDEGIDLAPVVREAALLALPLAPLCREECEGPAPDRFPTTVEDEVGSGEMPRDPRWAALDELTFDP